jgi:hypothetical protein
VTASVLFAALAAAFAFIALLSSRKCERYSDEVKEIARALHSSRSKVAAIESAVDALHDQFHQLRGKFYASRRKSQENGDDSREDTLISTPVTPIAGPSGVDSVAWKARMRGQYLKPGK